MAEASNNQSTPPTAPQTASADASVKAPPGAISPDRMATGARKPMLSRLPMVPLAVAMMLGITVGRYLPVPLGLHGVLAIAGLLVAIVSIRKACMGLITSIGLLAAVTGISAGYSQITYFSVDRDDIVTYSSDTPILSTIRGQIVTSPMIVEDPPGKSSGYQRPPRTTFILKAGQVEVVVPSTSQTRPSAREWRPATGLVRVTLAEGDTNRHFAAGMEVQIVGTLWRVMPPDNPGQTDWITYGRENRMLTRFSAPGLDNVTVLDSRSLSAIERAFWHVRSAARQHLAGFGEADDGMLVNALIIGERHPALANLNQEMIRAGVAHFLSISGQHLAIFLGFMYLICRVSSLSPRRSAMIVLVIMAMYMLITEPNAPLFRSAIMAAALCLATISGRQYSALNAIAAATVVVLAFDPMQLFSAGFQLSFGIVAGMVVLHRPMRDLLFGRWLKRRGLVVFRDGDRLRRWLTMSAADWAIMAITASTNAYIVSAPLVAYHFGLFSPYASVLSIALSPLVVAVLVPGYISMALAWPMPNLSAFFGQLAARAADALAWSVDAGSHLPGLCLRLRPVSIWWVIACYVAVAVVVYRRHLPHPKIWIATALLGLAGLTAYTQRTAPPPTMAELNVLAVGDGQCVILRTPDGKTFVIDAGTRSSTDIAGRVIEPFIFQQRLPEPTAAFVSHANTDHYNAMPSLNGLEQIYVNDYFSDPAMSKDSNDPGLTAAGLMLDELQTRGVQIVRLRAGMKIALDGRTSVEVLWPPASPGRKLNVNDTSLALRITCDGQRVILPGDMDTVGQTALTTDPSAVAADVMLLPHHGSWRPTVPGFVAAVNPRHIISSNSYEFRAPAGIDEARKFYLQLHAGRCFYSTAGKGWIKVRFGCGEVDVQTMR